MRESNSFGSSESSTLYYLMNKDKKVLELEIVKNIIDCDVNLISEIDKNILPIGFKNIASWLDNRKPPKHRKHIEDLLKLCQIDNLKDYLDVTYALSLNDCFWVKPKNSNLVWSDISLYSNEFNEVIAHLAFEGGVGLRGEKFSSTSPEFGTDGSFAKCWTRDENSNIVLLKRGSQGYANAGLEPYSEFYASQLSKEICDSYVEYDLIKYHNHLASSCPLFTDETLGYTPASSVLSENSFFKIMKYFDSIGSGDLFRSMIVLDGIILNQDRHLKNFGVVFDNESLRILGMAPVFDNNISLLTYALDDDLINLDNYLSTKGSKFSGDWVKEASVCLTPKLRRTLNNLYGFRFKKHPNFNLPDERLEILNKVVNDQIKKILTYGN